MTSQAWNAWHVLRVYLSQVRKYCKGPFHTCPFLACLAATAACVMAANRVGNTITLLVTSCTWTYQNDLKTTTDHWLASNWVTRSSQSDLKELTVGYSITGCNVLYRDISKEPQKRTAGYWITDCNVSNRPQKLTVDYLITACKVLYRDISEWPQKLTVGYWITGCSTLSSMQGHLRTASKRPQTWQSIR